MKTAATDTSGTICEQSDLTESQDTSAVAGRALLASLEEAIELNLQSFLDAGNALTRIREESLYRWSHPTFDAYCHGRWGFTHRRANQLIEAAGVVQGLKGEDGQGLGTMVPVHCPSSQSTDLRSEDGSTAGTAVPARDSSAREANPPTVPAINERQARELAKAPPKKRREALARAAAVAPKDGKTGKPKVTAKAIKKAVAEMNAPATEAVPADPAAPPWAEFERRVLAVTSALRSAAVELRDVLEYDSGTKRIAARWARQFGFTESVGALNSIIRRIEDRIPAEAADNPDGFLTREAVARRAAEAGKKGGN